MDPTSINPNDMYCSEMRVTMVNSKDWTVNLIGEGPGTTTAVGVPWHVPYRHPDGGGIDFVPEVGATCYVLWHPEDSFPVILGFSSPYHRDLDFGSGRRGLNPGDVIMWTRDDNRIVLRRGGNIEIQSSNECRRTYLASTNTIKEVSGNFYQKTRGGDVEWVTESDNSTGSSKGAAKYRASYKRRETDSSPIFVVEAGSLGTTSTGFSSNGEHVLKWCVGDEKNPSFMIRVDEYGNLETTISGSARISVGGDRSTTVTGRESITADNITHTVTSGNYSVIARSGEHIMDVRNSTENVSGVKTIKAAAIRLGRSASKPAVLGPELVQWLASHVHPMPGAPPASAPALGAILSKTVMLE